MENTVIVLLLLCALSSAKEAQSKTNPHPDPFDLYSELRDINVQLAEDRLLIQQLQKDKQELEAKLKELEEQTSQLEPMKEKLEAQATELTSIKTWANVTSNHVESLREDREVGKVAFTASLMTSGSAYTGPYKVNTPLIFRHVISNVGNAYSPNTGFFIAPVKGTYHFEFYICSWSKNYHRSAAGLVKNGEHVVLAHERGPNGHSSASNGATLLLEPGDVVFLSLWHDTAIYDNHLHYTSFSGHMLFPM